MSEKKSKLPDSAKTPRPEAELRDTELDKVSGGKPAAFNPQPDPPGD